MDIDLKKLEYIDATDEYEKYFDDFDCGDDDCNIFLKTKALGQQERILSKTTLTFFNNLLVGYFSTSNSSLKKEDLELNYVHEINYSKIPALLIGQLAVDLRYTGQGIGTILLKKCLKNAYEGTKDTGCRVVYVDARPKEKIVKLYKKLQFKTLKNQEYIIERILKGESLEKPVQMYRDIWAPLPSERLYPSEDLYPAENDDFMN
jgi:GNAT superfamily N-acetyltransferase